jgi:parallel beta-helix repeat protein
VTITNNTFDNCISNGLISEASYDSEIWDNSFGAYKGMPYGLYFAQTSGFTISGNRITHCNGAAIRLHESGSNRIFGNYVVENMYAIAEGYFSADNIFYHNDFVHNTRLIIDETPQAPSSGDDLNNSCEGNYWSDYHGTDTNGDGVGDTPFIIDSSRIDYYPLVNLYWNPGDINHDLKVGIMDLAKVGRAMGTKPGDVLWNPHADITGVQRLVPDGKVDIKDAAVVA